MALAGEHIQVLVDGYDLTGDHNRVNIDDKRVMMNTTTFGDSVRKFIMGQRHAGLQHRGYMNADVAKSHPVLKGVDVDGVVSILVGQNDTPQVGDPVYCMAARQNRYQISAQVGGVIPFVATFANAGDRIGWGEALVVDASITDSTTGTAVDYGVSTNNGGAIILHITQATLTDTYNILVEGSADDIAYSTLGTFTADGSMVNSEHVSVIGNIPRYVRYRTVRTGSADDSLNLTVNLVRF